MGLNTWQPVTVMVPQTGGDPVQLLGREVKRPGGFVVNLSRALTGVSAVVFLFRRQPTAAAFSRNPVIPPEEGRILEAIGLLDGSAYNCSHTEPVWAIAYGAAGVVSVSAVE